MAAIAVKVVAMAVQDADNLLNLSFNEFDLSLREYANLNNVPIIKDAGLAMLEQIIMLNRPLRILEIGTAIGYSAIRMNRLIDSEIYTIERNENMYNEATKNIKAINKENKIHIIYKDALEAFDDVKDIKFDLIFIDAAKAQYKKFFEIYTKLLNDNGMVVCDNMLFHGLVNDSNYENMSRSLRGLVRKLKDFHEYLLTNESYDSAIYDIGDGMAVSILK
jgi:predicted O-methyltransferase YrrM